MSSFYEQYVQLNKVNKDLEAVDWEFDLLSVQTLSFFRKKVNGRVTVHPSREVQEFLKSLTENSILKHVLSTRIKKLILTIIDEELTSLAEKAEEEAREVLTSLPPQGGQS